MSVEHLDLIEFGPTLLMNLFTLLVLYFILKKYFFEKVRAFIQTREQTIKDTFDNADHVNKQAEERLNAYNAQLSDIDSKSRKIIKESKQKADARAEEIIAEANRKSSELMKQAEKDIERERLRAVDDMREHIATLAILAAERILEKELDARSHMAIIDSVIVEAGNMLSER